MVKGERDWEVTSKSTLWLLFQFKPQKIKYQKVKSVIE